jgi:hypothetical protein
MRFGHYVTVPNGQEGDVGEVQGLEVVHALRRFFALPEDNGADKPDYREGYQGEGHGAPLFELVGTLLDAPHGFEAVFFFSHEDKAFRTSQYATTVEVGGVC